MRVNPQLLYRIRRYGMCMRQPTDEPVERFPRRRAVEGHQSGRDARGADEAGAPAPPESGGDFNDVPLAADCLFEAMNGHVDGD